MDLPHDLEGTLQLARKACRVEERAMRPCALQAATQPGETFRACPELDDERFVVRKRIDRELVESAGVQQARRDARRKAVPRAGYDGYACPQRVARSRVCIYVKRVEKQVGASEAREVLGLRRKSREHETR